MVASESSGLPSGVVRVMTILGTDDSSSCATPFVVLKYADVSSGSLTFMLDAVCELYLIARFHAVTERVFVMRGATVPLAALRGSSESVMFFVPAGTLLISR